MSTDISKVPYAFAAITLYLLGWYLLLGQAVPVFPPSTRSGRNLQASATKLEIHSPAYLKRRANHLHRGAADKNLGVGHILQ